MTSASGFDAVAGAVRAATGGGAGSACGPAAGAAGAGLVWGAVDGGADAGAGKLWSRARAAVSVEAGPAAAGGAAAGGRFAEADAAGCCDAPPVLEGSGDLGFASAKGRMLGGARLSPFPCVVAAGNGPRDTRAGFGPRPGASGVEAGWPISTDDDGTGSGPAACPHHHVTMAPLAKITAAPAMRAHDPISRDLGGVTSGEVTDSAG